MYLGWLRKRLEGARTGQGHSPVVVCIHVTKAERHGMATFWAVVAGGGFGSGLRYLVAGSLQKQMSSGFPLGTLTVNLVGCLLIGLLATWFSGALEVREQVRVAILVGVLGGFTTFSSFGLETVSLVQRGQWGSAMLYVAVSNIVGFVAVWAGIRMVSGSVA